MRERDNNFGNSSGREDWPQHGADASSGRNKWVKDNRNNRRGEEQTPRHPDDNFGDWQGNWEDRLNMMYDTSNFMGEPRQVNSGLPYGSENDLDQIGYYPQQGNPYQRERERYRYNTGYNPNTDNPEEGDLYRQFDSRGNHG